MAALASPAVPACPLGRDPSGMGSLSRYLRPSHSSREPKLTWEWRGKVHEGNVRFSPKRSFVLDQPNVRFAPKAVIRRRSEIGQPLGTKRAGQVNTAKDQLFPRCAPPNDFCTLTPYQATCGGIKKR